MTEEPSGLRVLPGLFCEVSVEQEGGQVVAEARAVIGYVKERSEEAGSSSS